MIPIIWLLLQANFHILLLLWIFWIFQQTTISSLDFKIVKIVHIGWKLLVIYGRILDGRLRVYFVVTKLNLDNSSLFIKGSTYILDSVKINFSYLVRRRHSKAAEKPAVSKAWADPFRIGQARFRLFSLFTQITISSTGTALTIWIYFSVYRKGFILIILSRLPIPRAAQDAAGICEFQNTHDSYRKLFFHLQQQVGGRSLSFSFLHPRKEHFRSHVPATDS